MLNFPIFSRGKLQLGSVGSITDCVRSFGVHLLTEGRQRQNPFLAIEKPLSPLVY